MRLIFFLTISLAFAGRPPCLVKDLGLDVASAHFMKLVDFVTFERPLLDADALAHLAASAKPQNPADLLRADERARLPWRHAFAEALAAPGLDWAKVREAVHARLGSKTAQEQKTDTARRETTALPKPVLITKYDQHYENDRFEVFQVNGKTYAAAATEKNTYVIDVSTDTVIPIGGSTNRDGLKYFEHRGKPYLVGGSPEGAKFFDLTAMKPCDPFFTGGNERYGMATVGGKAIAFTVDSGPIGQTKQTKIQLQGMDGAGPTLKWHKAARAVGSSTIGGKPYLHGVNEEGKLYLVSLSEGNAEKTVDLGVPKEKYPGNARQVVYETPEGTRLLVPHQGGATIVDPVAGKVIDHLTFSNSTPDEMHVVQMGDVAYGAVASFADNHVEVFDLVTRKSVVKIPAPRHHRTGRIFAFRGVPYVTFGDVTGHVHVVEALTGYELGKVKIAEDSVDGITLVPTATGVDALATSGSEIHRVRLVGDGGKP